ncbi:unnamed protein product [Pieris macdunnoughi]|uniref:Major facilitator superfamily (MFS) profile domain-containing protein n=1 Tax=Pieris macdunnoughi TaxID=345717 RepID=A0A821TE48_9NEOP|nr:unnamed protein product [Pieris macdunnoughi]
MSIRNQVFACSVVSYLCFSTGIISCWPSSVIKVFSSENTTLNRVMTETEISLLGGLPSFGALCTIPLMGKVFDTLGRKYTIVMISLLQVIGWSIVCTFDYVLSTLIGFLITGLSSCIYLSVPVYVGEFCQESIRGTMTSGVLVLFPVGWMFSYLLGMLEYHTMNYVCLTISIVGTLLMFYLRESPLYLMKKGLEKEAAEVIAHYRGIKVNNKKVHREIENIQRALNPVFDDVTSETEKLHLNKKENKSLSTWQFLKKSRSTRRALLLSLVLYTAAIFQGQIVVQVYAEPLFSLAVPSMSATLSSVLFAVVNIFAALFVVYLVDSSGRRPLMIYSSICTAVFAVALGSQIQFSWAPNWVTAVFIYLFCFTYTTGAGTIPFTMSAEIFLPDIKNFATIVSFEYLFLGFFFVLFVYNPVVAAVGLGPLFYMFAGVCVLTTILCFFLMPETKGLTVDVIQYQFCSPKAQNSE